MTDFFRSEENIPLTIAASLAVAVLLALLAPAEQTLGSALKLVFVHAALMWVSFFMYTLAGIFSLVSLFSGGRKLYFWAQSSLRTGMLILFTTGMLGMITAKITWGGVVWQEPRMAMLAKMLLASGAVFVFSLILSGPKIIAALNIGLVVTIWWLLLKTEKIIHPNNPIFTSGDIAIKLFPLAITFALGLMALQIARLMQLQVSSKQ